MKEEKLGENKIGKKYLTKKQFGKQILFSLMRYDYVIP